jgi:hypothetical protein
MVGTEKKGVEKKRYSSSGQTGFDPAERFGGLVLRGRLETVAVTRKKRILKDC